ncbi:serine/threonine-protein kinase [Streptomyces sp. NBC_01803]|uniref:serine/threonine-protein kinase n=1 Tax=Streptomyces sp. NBC_01803 TaxID=2975946 RepID=UPI002DD9A591|nr:serine/threonine-protein kinase [Streptomyces sp. NBC_01803]WSA45687.1 serine/threonine protein kinase [Streptomyces sp. NBC_01803]
MEPLQAGDPRAIGAYRIVRRLGQGGMGRVYLGRSAGGRTVAVKVVHPHYATDARFRARFAREVAAARLVGGAWTAPVLDADPDAEIPWVATGYVAGPDLHRAVDAHGALPRHTVLALAAGLAEALAAVHERGLVHRDVKPSNVLLALEGPRLIDFGIARATDATAQLTATGATVGSPGYMSPEQVMGRQVGPETDVFAFGAVLAFAAGGRPPFTGESAPHLLYQVVHEEPSLDAVPQDLRGLVAACLAKDPAARPALKEVAAACAGEGGAAGLVGPGWLPQPVVEDVSRRAVGLLDLEEVPPEAVASAPAGMFGPPTTHTAGITTPPFGSGTSADSPPGRRRARLVVPAVALGVLLLLGGVLGAGLLDGSGDSAGSGGSDGTDGGGDSDGDDGGGGGDALPAEYVGEWEGQLTVLGLPGGPLALTLENGRVGDRVGTATSSDAMGLSTCVDRLTLKEVGEREITFDARVDQEESSQTNFCVEGDFEVILSLDDAGALRYTSNQPGGDLEGELRRP